MVQWHCISSCLLNIFVTLVALPCGAGSTIVIVRGRTKLLACLHIFTQRFVAVALSLCVSSISTTTAFIYAWSVAALWWFMLGVVIKKEMKTIYIVPQPKNGGMYTCFTMVVCPSVWKVVSTYYCIIFWVLTYNDDTSYMCCGCCPWSDEDSYLF